MPVFDQSGSAQQKKLTYSKLLNNLLEIRTGDSCLFAKITTFNYDLQTKIGSEKTENFLTEDQFKIRLKDLDHENLIKELKIIQKNYIQETKTKQKANENENLSSTSEWDDPHFQGQQAIEAFEKYNHPLNNRLKEELKILHESTPLDSTIIKLEEEQQRSLTRWKKFVKEVDDRQNATNTWPLYLASGFIKVHFEDEKIIHAPLLLKMAKVEIKGSVVNLETNGDWIINEKLIWILKNHDLVITNDQISTENRTFLDLMAELLPYLKIDSQPLTFYNQRFANAKREEIKNRKVELSPGVMLGFFYPTGNYLRKLAKEIIERDEVDDILKTHPHKQLYEKKVSEALENDYQQLVKIQASSYAQDKALISALNQDTIIWGPPGTGKSQVIANIIANVLYNQKSAIVMSEKKAALDVLRKRLKGLSIFAFFFVFDVRFSKEAFYKPLKEFIEIVEKAKTIAHRQEQTLISPEQKAVINKIETFKAQNKFQAIINAYKNADGDIQKIKKIANINPRYHFPLEATNEGEFIELTGQRNEFKKNGYLFWWKYPDLFISEAKKAYKIQNELQINDLNKFVKPYRFASLEEMQSLAQVPEILKYSYKHQDDEKFIIDFLAQATADKIEKKFPFTDRQEYKKYNNFRAAISSGRRKPENFISDHMEVIQTLFPIVITTTSTAFANWKKEAFDYAIIDEASQMFLENGLPIMYLSKTKILAGDPEQMQPTSWFSTRDIAEEEDEADNAENAISVLNYAIDKQVYTVMLDQNYRSHAAALMSFSSQKFYQSKLEVIDKNNHYEAQPIEVFNVGGAWLKNTNLQEAEKVIVLLKNHASFYHSIIILAFNIKQKQLIEELLMDQAKELWDQRVIGDKSITIRNIENIQGDEADLVIASVVYDAHTKMGGTYVAKKGFGKNALNVAISRAKTKMIVVKSVTAETISPTNSEDFLVFKAWLHFLDLQAAEQRTYSSLKISAQQYGDFESTFEEDVWARLLKDLHFPDPERYEISRQYPIGSQRLDFAILRNQKDFILGIEVDGYDYHLGMGIDKYLQDKSREDFIKSKGYKLVRISEIRWYLSPNQVLMEIQNLLTEILTAPVSSQNAQIIAEQ